MHRPNPARPDHIAKVLHRPTPSFASVFSRPPPSLPFLPRWIGPIISISRITAVIIALIMIMNGRFDGDKDLPECESQRERFLPLARRPCGTPSHSCASVLFLIPCPFKSVLMTSSEWVNVLPLRPIPGVTEVLREMTSGRRARIRRATMRAERAVSLI